VLPEGGQREVFFYKIEVVFLLEEVIDLRRPRGGLQLLEEGVFVAEAVAGVAAISVYLGMSSSLLEHPGAL
jgi:hypothetical protein